MNRKAIAIDLIEQGLTNEQVAKAACISPTYAKDIREAVARAKGKKRFKRNYLQTVELSELKL